MHVAHLTVGDDIDPAEKEQLEAQTDFKDALVLQRIQQIGRTVACSASVGLVFLCVSSGVFSAGLQPMDKPLELEGGSDVRNHGTMRHAQWRQIVGLCSILALAGLGAFFALSPGSALAVSNLSRGVLRSWPSAVNPMRALRTVFYCCLFMVVGPSLMLLNKHIMQGLDFHYPLSLSLLGMLSSAICSRTAVMLGFARVRPESLEIVAGYNWYKVALPIGLCKAITLAAGNAVYLHLGLGFIQMLKAFTPVFVLSAMRIFLSTMPSRAAVGFVCIIVLGTMVEVKGELHATAVGLLLMFTSEVMEALGLVLTQKLLQNSKFSIVEGMYVLSVPGAMCLMTLAAALEWPQMVSAGHHRMVLDQPSWFASAAALGLLVNFVGYCVVQATSSLTCKILNIFRCIGLVFIGALCYGEVVGSLEMAGYSIALVGFCGYNFVQVFPESGEQLEKATCRRCAGTPGSIVADDSRERREKNFV